MLWLHDVSPRNDVECIVKVAKGTSSYSGVPFSCSTNDRVVVDSKPSGLHTGLEFHKLLLSSRFFATGISFPS